MKTPCGWHDSCDRVPGYGWKSTADDTIPVTESRDMDERALRTTQFLWQNHENSIQCGPKYTYSIWLSTHTLRSSRMFMCCKELLQTSRNSLPTRLQAIIQSGGCCQTPRLPRCLNPRCTIDNPPLLRRVSNWRDWIDWMPKFPQERHVLRLNSYTLGADGEVSCTSYIFKIKMMIKIMG